MDAQHFDRLSVLASNGSSRRRVVSALLGAALGATLAFGESEGRKRRRKAKKKHQVQCEVIRCDPQPAANWTGTWSTLLDGINPGQAIFIQTGNTVSGTYSNPTGSGTLSGQLYGEARDVFGGNYQQTSDGTAGHFNIGLHEPDYFSGAYGHFENEEIVAAGVWTGTRL